MAIVVKVGQTWREKIGDRRVFKFSRIADGFIYYIDPVDGRERGFGNVRSDGTADGWEVNWEMIDAGVAVSKASMTDGCFCALCGDHAPMSVPNRPDGKTFICFSCRQGWIPAGM